MLAITHSSYLTSNTRADLLASASSKRSTPRIRTHGHDQLQSRQLWIESKTMSEEHLKDSDLINTRNSLSDLQHFLSVKDNTPSRPGVRKRGPSSQIQDQQLDVSNDVRRLLASPLQQPRGASSKLSGPQAMGLRALHTAVRNLRDRSANTDTPVGELDTSEVEASLEQTIRAFDPLNAYLARPTDEHGDDETTKDQDDDAPMSSGDDKDKGKGKVRGRSVPLQRDVHSVSVSH